MKMTWVKFAKKIGWTQSYLSQVFNGYFIPSARMIDKARPVLKKSEKWWNDATVSERQALLEKARKRLTKEG